MKYRTLRKWRLNRTLKQRGGFIFGNAATTEEKEKVRQIMSDEDEKNKYEAIYETFKALGDDKDLNKDERIAKMVHDTIQSNKIRRPILANSPTTAQREGPEKSTKSLRGNSPAPNAAKSNPVVHLSGATALPASSNTPTELGQVVQGNVRGRSESRSASTDRPRSASQIRVNVGFRKENADDYGNPRGTSLDRVSLSYPISTEPDVIENAAIVPGTDAPVIVDASIAPSSRVTDAPSPAKTQAPVEGSIVQSGPVDIIEGSIVASVPDAEEVRFFQEKGIEPTVFNPKDFNFFAHFRKESENLINETRYIELLRAINI